MNGRVYDPTLARFLSVDPHIQAPSNLQSYNRYSYVINNPLSYTDPSGYFFKKIGKWVKKKWKQIRRVAIAVVAVYACVQTAGAACGAAAKAMTFSATMAARRTRDHGGSWKQAFKSAAFSAATALAFHGAGVAYADVSAGMSSTFSKFATKVAIHGATGCAIASAQGGSCGDGFVSSGVAAGYSFATNGGIFGDDQWLSIVEVGAVGGITEQTLGGSFSDGFERGTAGQAYNALQFLVPVAAAVARFGPRVVKGVKSMRSARQTRSALKTDKSSGRFSKEKQALVDMAKQDKRRGGMSADDMTAYKDLNRGLKDPFPSNRVRGPEIHPNRPHGRFPHGHVGPIDHIPVN